MSTDRQQDAGLDRLVRAALQGDSPPEGAVCPDADVIAAYTAGALAARERADVEPHLAACQRCQAVIAMLAADADAEAARPGAAVPAASPGSWFRRLRVAWLVPAGAAALAVILYVATQPDATPFGPEADNARSAAGAPERTLAKAADTASSPRDPLAPPAEPTRQKGELGRSVAAPRTGNELKAAPPAKSETTLALAEQAPPSPAPAAPAATAPAPAAPAQARDMAAIDFADVSLDELWRRAEIVVVGRVGPAQPRADKDRGGAGRVAAAVPADGIIVVEALKQPDGATLAGRLEVPAASTAATHRAATEYVFFLTRVKGADGMTQLVSVGSVSLETRRDETLARLRQLAGAPRK